MNKKSSFLIPLLLALLVLVTGRAFAQGSVVTTLSAEPGEATVGDPVAITLSVTHPTGYFVIVPQLEMQWGDFAIVGQSPTTTAENEDGSETTTVVYDTRLFAPGTFQPRR
ncbi:MAG: hypothetical protein R3C44_20640 [Chloroflexota bacterium]